MVRVNEVPLLLDGDLTTGWIRRERRIVKRFLKLKVFSPSPYTREAQVEIHIPKMAYRYAKRVSEITGLPLETVLNSRPVREYIKRLKEEVVIKLNR